MVVDGMVLLYMPELAGHHTSREWDSISGTGEHRNHSLSVEYHSGHSIQRDDVVCLCVQVPLHFRSRDVDVAVLVDSRSNFSGTRRFRVHSLPDWVQHPFIYHLRMAPHHPTAGPQRLIIFINSHHISFAPRRLGGLRRHTRHFL